MNILGLNRFWKGPTGLKFLRRGGGGGGGDQTDYSGAVIDDYIGGGVYAGIMSIGGTDYHIIAGLASSESGPLALKLTGDETPGTTSGTDGLANTQAMIDAGAASHPAADYCVNYSNEGFEDWYLGSRQEMLTVRTSLAQFNPVHPEYLALDQSQAYIWTSTEVFGIYGYRLRLDPYNDSYTGKTTTYRVRPIRRIPV